MLIRHPLNPCLPLYGIRWAVLRWCGRCLQWMCHGRGRGGVRTHCWHYTGLRNTARRHQRQCEQPTIVTVVGFMSRNHILVLSNTFRLERKALASRPICAETMQTQMPTLTPTPYGSFERGTKPTRSTGLTHEHMFPFRDNYQECKEARCGNYLTGKYPRVISINASV